MARKKPAVVEHVQEKREPYATVVRYGWFKYSVRVEDPDGYRGSHWTTVGTRGHAESLATRKLRKLKREMTWKNDVKRFDLT